MDCVYFLLWHLVLLEYRKSYITLSRSDKSAWVDVSAILYCTLQNLRICCFIFLFSFLCLACLFSA